MGGLKSKMPITTWTFVIGSLALAGIFPLAGFWSKDEILATTLEHHFTGLYILGSVVAFMTAFYMFRLIFVAFFGKQKGDHHAHESSWVMTLPLVLLSVFSIFAGFINSPWFYNIFGKSFSTYIFFGEPEVPKFNFAVAGISTLLAVGGIFLAWLVYGKKVINAEKVSVKYKGLYKLLYNKFYIDELYQWLFDKVMLLAGKIFDWVDHYIIDGTFDGFARLVNGTGGKVRFVQTGSLQNYALILFCAVIIIVILVTTPILGGAFR
jgi:NADH-quinone oxidoreductase subunit L